MWGSFVRNYDVSAPLVDEEMLSLQSQAGTVWSWVTLAPNTPGNVNPGIKIADIRVMVQRAWVVEVFVLGAPFRAPATASDARSFALGSLRCQLFDVAPRNILFLPRLGPRGVLTSLTARQFQIYLEFSPTLVFAAPASQAPITVVCACTPTSNIIQHRGTSVLYTPDGAAGPGFSEIIPSWVSELQFSAGLNETGAIGAGQVRQLDASGNVVATATFGAIYVNASMSLHPLAVEVVVSNDGATGRRPVTIRWI